MATPHFFILGRPRSGTTLLKMLFDAHPNVMIAPELPIFLMLYQKFSKVKTWDAEARKSFINHVFQPASFNNRKLENLRLDREAFRADVMGMDDNCTIQELLFKINEHSASIFPKEEIKLVGDKNPVYSIFIRRLSRIFPEARFICIVRDYRDNYVSIKNLNEVAFDAPVVSLQAFRWKFINLRFYEYARKFPKRFYMIRYEDLVENPTASLSALCSFLEIPYNPSVFDFYHKKDEMLEMCNHPQILKIHGSLMNPVNTGRLGLWRKQMTPQEISLADQIVGNTAELLKYERADRQFRAKNFFSPLPMILYTRILFKLMVWGSYLPYRENRWLAMNVTSLVKIFKAYKGNRTAALTPERI